MQQGMFLNPQTGLQDVAKIAKLAKIKVPGVGIDVTSGEAAAAYALLKSIERHVASQGQTPPPEVKLWDDAGIFSQVLQQWLRTKGRKADPQTVQLVAQFWIHYTQIAMQQIQPGSQPGQAPQQGSQPGQQASAPGGSPNNVGGGSVLGDAAQRVHQADRAAESQARTQLNQES
jgi:hypothetical protein